MNPLLLPQAGGLGSLLTSAGQNNPWAPPTAAALPGIAPGSAAPGGMGAPSQYKGLSGFVDRFLHPNNPIGQLGKYISQSAGGVFGGVYNAADQDAEKQQSDQMARTKYALELAKAQQPEYRTVGNQLVAVPQNGGAPSVAFTGQPETTDLQRNYEYLLAQDKANGTNYAQSFLASKADPVTSVPGVDEQGNSILRFLPRSQMGGAPAPGGIGGAGGDALPPGYSVRGLTPSTAAPVLSGAKTTGKISRAQADTVRRSLGPNGQAAFQQWMSQNNIVIGD